MTFERAFFLIALVMITVIMGLAVSTVSDDPQPAVIYAMGGGTIVSPIPQTVVPNSTASDNNMPAIFQTATALAIREESLNPIFQTATAANFRPIVTALPDTGGGSGELPMTGGGGGGYEFSEDLTFLTQDQRLLIKTVNMDLTVQDVVATNEEIQALVQDNNGWIVTSTIDRPKDRNSNYVTSYLTMRVPADQLDSLVMKIKDLALTVNSENVQGQDVTDQYNDQQSQLRNLETAEAQLLALLQTSVNNAAVLEIFNQLTSIRNDIEQIKGQLQYYAQSAVYSTIELRMSPPYISPTPSTTFTPSPTATFTPTATDTGWKPRETFNNASDSAIHTAQTAIDGIIWISIYGLLLLMVGLPLWALYRWRKR